MKRLDAHCADPRLLNRVRETVLSGGTPDIAPRAVIGASWRRMQAHGLNPAGAPEVAPLADMELERRRVESGLLPLIPGLRSQLLPVAEAAGELLVVTDADGRVLWREGGRQVLRYADHLGFVGGSAWTEGNVGTNAIGTCLVEQTAVHIHAAEHYAESHTAWTCAAAPLHDPLTGRVLGAVDLSGPARTAHPNTLALVIAAARLVELELRARHDRRLATLRAHAAPLLARIGGRAIAVTTDGRTAAAIGMTAPDHVVLPDDPGPGEIWLPSLGRATVEPVPGGWLIRLDGDRPEHPGTAVRLDLDLTGVHPMVRVAGPSESWSHTLSPRHAEILLALIRNPAGRTAGELADDLFADAGRKVTVRAEMSRLRRTLGPLLRTQPYRVALGVAATVRLPQDPLALLPGSSAPVVADARARR